MTGPISIHGNPNARVWLFDFDNTLVALEKDVDWAASRRELESYLRSQGIDAAVFKEFPARNLPLYNALLTRLLHGAAGGSDDVIVAPSFVDGTTLMQCASAIIEAHELRGVEHAEALAGGPELLRLLHAHDNPVAIVTSNSSRTVEHWLARHRLTAEVDVIVGRDSLLPLKPAAAMVVRALELCASTPAEAVFVGDSEADLQAARRAQIGFFAIAATIEARTELERRGARNVFSSPAELAVHLGLASLFDDGASKDRIR